MVKEKLRKISLCLVLGVGSLVGVPMCIDEIEELMHRMREPKIAHVLPDGTEKSDPPTDRQKAD